MAQAFGNTVTTPLSTALNNKINPSPLAPIKPASAGLGSFNLGGGSQSSTTSNQTSTPAQANFKTGVSTIQPQVSGYSSNSTASPAIKSVTTTYHPPATNVTGGNQVASSNASIPLKPTTSIAPVSPIDPTIRNYNEGPTNGPTTSSYASGGQYVGTDPNQAQKYLNSGVIGATQNDTNSYSPNFSNSVTRLANTQTSPYNQNSVNDQNALITATQGNQQYQDKANQIGTTLGGQIQDIASRGTLGGNSMSSTGETSPVALGRGALIAQNTAGLEQAAIANANTQLGANAQGLTGQAQQQTGFNEAGGLANSQQNLQQSALSNATGYAQPVAGQSFALNPLTGGLYGSTGANGAGSYTGNQVIDNSINQALAYYRAGGDINDPQITKLLSISPLAQQAFNQAIQSGGGVNPTTQSATAQNTASQANNYQNQAIALDSALKNLGNVSTTAVNFLQSNNLLNPTGNPLYDKPINSYIAQVQNPGAVTTYASILADLDNYKSQILAANSGQTPTALTQAVQSTDPGTLSAPQLQAYLQNLDSLGKQQLNTAQQQAGALGSNGYVGSPAGVNTNLQTPANSNPSNLTGTQAGQVGLGEGLNAIGGIEGLFHNITGAAWALF